MTIRVPLGSIRNTAISFVALAMLSGCLSGEVGANPADNGLAETNVSGSVGDGPIVGADMTVYSTNGNPLAVFQSDAKALYNVSIGAADEHFPLTISANGGTDLVTGLSPDFELSSAVFDVGDTSVANVNPFSTIAVELALLLPGGMTLDNLSEAESIVSDALNSGLAGLAASGPIRSPIDETNVSEIVKASETLAEVIRRTRSLLQGAGFNTSGDQVVRNLAADLTDTVVDGLGASNTDRRTAAVSTIVSSQVLLESMANELHVNGVDASDAMRSAIDQVTDSSPTVSIDQLGVTSEMIAKTRIGLAAAYAIDPDPAIRQLHAVVSGVSAGQNGTLIRIVFPSDYRNVLQSALVLIPNAGDATIDLVNAIARSNGDIDDENLAPIIQGTPATAVLAGAAYAFTPDAVDPNGDVLTFDIANIPSWSTFELATGTLSGSPQSGDVGTYANITISAFDGEFTVELPAFTIIVSDTNMAPQISGVAPGTVMVGDDYEFIPTASDPENDALTFSILGRPSWASFDSSTGQLSGTPGVIDAGTQSGITISVSDGQNSASLAPFAITVTVLAANSAPQISGVAPATVAAGESYSFTPSASDSDGDVLTFSISGLPSWASFDAATGRVSGAPSQADVGTYTAIAITVTDGLATDSLAPFSVTVQAISVGSVTLNWTAPTENEDGSTLTDLAGYKIYWGTTAGNYPNSITINNASVTTYVVDNLSPGTYEFVASSFNSSGVESRYSGSATKIIQ